MEPVSTPSPSPAPTEAAVSQPIRTLGDLFAFLKSKTVKPVYLPLSGCDFRFGDIKCPAETAVQVTLKGKANYLHANTIKTAENVNFIAAQAPNTDLARGLYLKAALERASVLVDLTNEGDNHPGDPKVDEHYPKEIGEQKTFASVVITFKKKRETANANISILCYQVLDQETQREREIVRVHYQGWQDSQGSTLDELHQLIAIVNQQAEESGYPHLSPMVNCRAGVGRTGTFITATTIHRLALERKLVENPLKLLCQVIIRARSQRGHHFVQSVSQLETLVQFTKSLTLSPNPKK